MQNTSNKLFSGRRKHIPIGHASSIVNFVNYMSPIESNFTSLLFGFEY